ncbi:MAG: MFS transporter [Muribaculaceae bacterium]|nr:MFS transporter [Muribaculaceae bacterium]
MTDTNKQLSRRNPWWWIPTLYFVEALPYAAVMTVSVIMYKNLGLSNTDIALYTGWLYLPWVIKPFWSPAVDIVRSKRWWVLAMQWGMAAGIALLTLALPAPAFVRLTLGAFWLVAFMSATHDIAADGFYMLGLSEHDQVMYVGIRSTFYRIGSLAGQGVLVMLAGTIEDHGGSAQTAWMITFGVLSAFFCLTALYHTVVLPRPKADADRRAGSFGALTREFMGTFVSFFKKPQIGTAIAFMLLYRLPEAQLVKLISPFLLDSPEAGGLGLSVSQVGVVYGTIGVSGLVIGGILGGLAAARGGLKKWLQPMVWMMSLTCVTFLYLSYADAPSLLTVNVCVFIEQFGYGFGFTAYMLYLIYFSEGPLQTSHYAICTGFMALSMMLPGMAAGWIQEQLGYQNFFIWVMVCCTATVAVSRFIKVDADFGKKNSSK